MSELEYRRRMVIDAARLAEAVADDPRHHRLATTISKAIRLQSCLVDLRQAKDACEAVAWLLASPRGSGSTRKLITESSLLSTAVQLYVRAVGLAGKRGERGSVAIRNALVGTDLDDHDALLALRNRALAHVHTHERLNDRVWHAGMILFVETDNSGHRLLATGRSVQFDGASLARAKRAIPVAATLLDGRLSKALEKVRTLVETNPVEPRIFEALAVDPATLMGSEAVAAAILRGVREGGSYVVQTAE
jgi:hypothetical protein